MNTPNPHATDAAGDAVEMNSVEASQGAKTGHIRWVLVVSLALGIVALGAAFLGYTAAHHASAPPPAASQSAG